HIARVDRRAPAGGHTAADQRGGLQRDVFVDLDQRVGRHGHVRLEGAQVGHRADAFAAGVDPERAVRGGPAEYPGAEVTHVGAPAHAHPAPPAAGQEGQHDVVADLEVINALAELGDDTGAFVATEDRRPVERDVAGVEMVVAVTDAGGGELDGGLSALRRVELDLLDGPPRVGAGFPQQCAWNLHCAVLSRVVAINQPIYSIDGHDFVARESERQYSKRLPWLVNRPRRMAPRRAKPQ